jgi:hypothetical protein
MGQEHTPNSLFLYDFASRQELKPDAELKAAVKPDVAGRDGCFVQIEIDLEFIMIKRDPSRPVGGGSDGHSGD